MLRIDRSMCDGVSGILTGISELQRDDEVRSDDIQHLRRTKFTFPGVLFGSLFECSYAPHGDCTHAQYCLLREGEYPKKSVSEASMSESLRELVTQAFEWPILTYMV